MKETGNAFLTLKMHVLELMEEGEEEESGEGEQRQGGRILKQSCQLLSNSSNS